MIFNDTSDLSNGFVQQTWFAYKGNNKWPAAGTDKYNRVLIVANRKLRELCGKGTKNWSFFWQLSSLGTITSGQQAYNFANTVIKPSDFAYIYDGDTEIAKLPIVKPQQRGNYTSGIYLTGKNPRVANFIETIGANHQFVGKTLKIGTYDRPTPLSAEGDTIPLNDPDWLVYETAAELARNDPAKDDQFGNLQGIANDKFTDLVATDEGSPFEQPSGAGYSNQGNAAGYGHE